MPTLPDYPGVSWIHLMNLLVSCKSHHISWMKATLDLFSTNLNYKFSLNLKILRVFKCMLWFLAEFSSIFHPTCHGCLQKLGAAYIYFERSGEVGLLVVLFCWGWGGGEGIGTNERISRFQICRSKLAFLL